MRLMVLISILVGCPAFCRTTVQEKILRFDPATVELIGTVETQTFPGPPSYESIDRGDEIERGWYLRLKEAVTVEANSPTTDLGWKTEKHVRVLHMAVDWQRIPEKRLAVGKVVRVKGKLFNRQNGHHHSRVLIDVGELREASQ